MDKVYGYPVDTLCPDSPARDCNLQVPGDWQRYASSGDIPQPVTGSLVLCAGPYAYVFFGLVHGELSRMFSDKVYRLELASLVWKRLKFSAKSQAEPEMRDKVSGCVLPDGSMLLFGGWSAPIRHIQEGARFEEDPEYEGRAGWNNELFRFLPDQCEYH